MKINLLFKTPDAVESALKNEFPLAEQTGRNYPDFISEEDIIQDTDLWNKAKIVLDKFFEYGEYCSVEVDLDEGTAKVLEVS